MNRQQTPLKYQNLKGLYTASTARLWKLPWPEHTQWGQLSGAAQAPRWLKPWWYLRGARTLIPKIDSTMIGTGSPSDGCETSSPCQRFFFWGWDCPFIRDAHFCVSFWAKICLTQSQVLAGTTKLSLPHRPQTNMSTDIYIYIFIITSLLLL